MVHSSDLNFPVDLFYPILYYVKDLTLLWTDCRAVSRDFSRAAERVFAAKHLSKTWLNIDGGVWYSQEHGKVLLSSSFSFDRIDPSNPSRAVFADKECAPEFRKTLTARLRSRLRYGNLPHDPKILVQIRREINDTALPGLEHDFGRLELSFDWKGMYSAFFREERELKERMSAGIDGRRAKMMELKAQTDRGELDVMDAVETWALGYGKALEDIRKALRRERICREVLEKDGVRWTWGKGDDAIELEALKEHRFMISMEEPYSDESDWGEDDKEAADEDREDQDDDESWESSEDEDGMQEE